MKISVRGTSHLAQTMVRAAALRGFEISIPPVDVMFCAHDVLDHSNLEAAHMWFEGCLPFLQTSSSPLVLVSQVPPGTTRVWAGQWASRVFYQVDTIIMSRALERAYVPEQFIIGCADPDVPLPLAYQEYLIRHEVVVRLMSYESAELAKCAINYMLWDQIRAARVLEEVAKKVGADYADVARALRGDARIGQHAYLRPGGPNQHLMRDVDTINRLRGLIKD